MHDYPIQRYRGWYGKLLGLHPRPFRARFGEGMEQTFADLLRERAQEGRGLFAFALFVFVETLFSIIRENVTHMTKNDMHIFLRPALVTAGLLSIPFFGVMFGDWAWGWPPFLVFGTILFTAGIAYELAGRHAKAGVLGGLVFGAMFAASVIATLRYLNPEEDVAGVVIITFLFCGLLFATTGYFIQRRFSRK